MTTIPTHLTDSQLIEELKRCARDERGATARLIAHLAEMDARQLHLGLGFSSLFAYCLQVLRLSESATCKRIDVARAARRYPGILDRLVDGSLSVTTARLIGSHLTRENHEELMAAAAGLGMRAVEELLARRFPRPDVAPLIRKLPARPSPAAIAVTPPEDALPGIGRGVPGLEPAQERPALPEAEIPLARPSSPPARPLATPLSADRYQIRFTASAATWKKLRVAQDLLRHAVPSGDPAEIVDRALTALIAELARKKCAAVKAPQRRRGTPSAASRHIPSKVRRVVWVRDRGHCAFVARSGRRCQERAFLEFHHVKPYAAGGEATVANVQLRCRAHNAYESVLFYGPSKAFRREGLARVGAAQAGLSPKDSTGRAAGS